MNSVRAGSSGGVRMVVAVQADEGRIRVAYSDADGELPGEDPLERIREHVRAMVREVVGHPVGVQVVVRPWQPGDGSDLVDWRSALRRWAAP